MSGDGEWLDTLHTRGYGRLASGVQAASAGTAEVSRITFATSDMRLAGFVRRMGKAETVDALVAIKDEAKPKLLPRDLSKLKTAFESRLKYLRGIPPDTDLPTTEGKP